MEKAKDIQAQLDQLQQEMHTKIEACDLQHNKEKNGVFAARRDAIANLIASKELPSNFWALAIISLLQEEDRQSTTTPHFLGPYDDVLLKTYMEELVVEYTEQGHRVSLRFRPNPYFEETELWAEAVDILDEEDEMPAGEEMWQFSGVTWKEGHGPQAAEDDEEEEEEDSADEGDTGGNARSGKRPRPPGASTSSSTQGPSVLEVFSEMPPHPEEDEEMDEEDDDAIAEATEEWEDEMSDRKMLLRMLELFIHHNPVSAAGKSTEASTTANGEADGVSAKKARTA